MSTSTELHPDYLDLVRKFPLRAIRTKRQHDAAMKIVTSLAVKGEDAMSHGERDYLDALDVLVADYDRRQTEHARSASGLDVLKALMEERGMRVNDLGEVIGSQPNASLILSGQRDMSKEVMRKLGEHFGVDAGLFLR